MFVVASLSTAFPAAVCQRRKICTLQGERRGREGGGKKVSVYLHHIPFPKERRRENREEEDVSVGDIRELQGSEWTQNLQGGGLVFFFPTSHFPPHLLGPSAECCVTTRREACTQINK